MGGRSCFITSGAFGDTLMCRVALSCLSSPVPTPLPSGSQSSSASPGSSSTFTAARLTMRSSPPSILPSSTCPASPPLSPPLAPPSPPCPPPSEDRRAGQDDTVAEVLDSLVGLQLLYQLLLVHVHTEGEKYTTRW